MPRNSVAAWALAGLLLAAVGAALWSAGRAASEAETTGRAKHAVGVEDAPGAAAAAAKTRKPGTASVFGLVLRGRERAPVAGQKVLLSPEKGDAWSVETDPQGAFRFERLPHGGPYELSVAAKGCGTVRVPGIALDRGEKRDVGALFLEPAVRVTVRVRDMQDRAVEGALVEEFPLPRDADFEWTKALAQIGQTPISVAKAATDAAGEAVFPETSVGDWTFTATKTGFALGATAWETVRADDERRVVEIRVETGHPLDGRVLEGDDRPVAGAVVLTGETETQWDAGTAPARRRCTTDADGRFAFAALPAGETELLVGRAGASPVSAAVVRVPLVSRYDVHLVGDGALEGRVTDEATGGPIDGAAVRSWSWEGGAQHAAEATTDAEGRYSLRTSAGPVNQVAVEKDGWTQIPLERAGGADRQTTLHEGETVVLDLRMRRGARLSGVVRGPQGPLAGAKVTVYFHRPDEWVERSATSGADGGFEFAGVPSGAAVVLAAKQGWYLPDAPANVWEELEKETLEPFRVRVADSGDATKDVTLARGAAIEGRVEDEAGAPLAGARVSEGASSVAPPTAADGAFRLDGVAPGEVRLVCTKEGWAQTTTPPVAVAAVGPATGVVLKMTRAARVRGTVSAEGGGALEGAMVLVARERPLAPGESEEPWREKYRWRDATVAAVRADGTYDAELPFGPPGRLLVRASSFGHAETDAAPVELVEGRELYVVDVTLADGVDLVGKVAAKDGAPIAGAEISVSPHREGSSDYGAPGDASPVVWAVTDAGGVFRVPHLPAKPRDVLVRARGRLTGRAVVALEERPTPSPTIVLAAELSIEGTVVFTDGTPAAGLSVTVPEGRDSGAVDGIAGGAGTAVTDARGAFRLGGLAEGAHDLDVEPSYGSPVNARGTSVKGVAAGTKGVRIVVEAGRTIGGRVVDPRGAPVVHAWITAVLSPSNGPDLGTDGQGAESDADGRFALLGLLEGPHDVTVHPQDSHGRRERTIPGVAVGERALEVVLEDGLRLSGVLVDKDGRGVARVALSVSPAVEGANESHQTMTAEDGKFVFAGLAAGPHRVVAATWGNGDKSWLLDPAPPVAAGATGVRITASKSAMVAGVVEDERGAPIEGAEVWARADDQGGSTRSRRDGTFEVVGLPHDAVFTVTAQFADRVSATIDDVAAGAAGLRLVLAKGRTSSGRLFDVEGKPTPGRRLSFHAADGRHEAEATTDSEGRFNVAGLMDGTYSAHVDVEDGDPIECGVLKAGETNVELRARR